MKKSRPRIGGSLADFARQQQAEDPAFAAALGQRRRTQVLARIRPRLVAAVVRFVDEIGEVLRDTRLEDLTGVAEFIDELADLDQTGAEATAELEADGVDVAAFTAKVYLRLVHQLVSDHFQDRDKAALWMATPNPWLPNNAAPRDLVAMWRGKKLMNYVLGALAASASSARSSRQPRGRRKGGRP